MKILVTGGAGFIGSHIVDKLISIGHEVVIIDNLSTGKEENINTKAKFYKADICDKNNIDNIFDEEEFEIVYHEAAHASVRESVDDPAFDANTNILGSLNILEACVKSKVKKIIFASTGGALYGDAEILPTPEDYDVKPVSPYGVAKLSIEQYLYYYKFQHNLNYTVLRYANVYGPKQDPFGEAGVVAIFSQKIVAGDQPIINGKGEQTRDYVFVGDVVSANIKALEGNKSCESYNVGTGRQVSVNELFKAIANISGKEVKEVHGPEPKGEQRTSALSYEKIKDDLGWEPEVGLEDGLRETYEWFKNK